MDMKYLICIMATGSLISSAQAAQAALAPGVVSAKWLQQNCGSLNSIQNGENPNIGSAAESGSCIGYLGALIESAPIMNPSLPPNARVCVSQEVKPASLANVVLDYMKKRPAVTPDPRLVV